MVIYRDGKAIGLTENEICRIYREVQMRNCKDEIVLKLSEDYNLDLNKIDLDIMSIATDEMSEIDDNDTIWDCEQDVYQRVIVRYLKERGIK